MPLEGVWKALRAIWTDASKATGSPRGLLGFLRRPSAPGDHFLPLPLCLAAQSLRHTRLAWPSSRLPPGILHGTKGGEILWQRQYLVVMVRTDCDITVTVRLSDDHVRASNPTDPGPFVCSAIIPPLSLSPARHYARSHSSRAPFSRASRPFYFPLTSTSSTPVLVPALAPRYELHLHFQLPRLDERFQLLACHSFPLSPVPSLGNAPTRAP